MEDRIRLIRCPRCNNINENDITTGNVLDDCPVCCGGGYVPIPPSSFICINCNGKGLVTDKNSVENEEKICGVCRGMGIIVI